MSSNQNEALLPIMILLGATATPIAFTLGQENETQKGGQGNYYVTRDMHSKRASKDRQRRQIRKLSSREFNGMSKRSSRAM
mmetsp:Transcript_760/g.1715  ORF Transcript_760/g.1715 Transcript_760/m.1715 type:complete len:81 (-) Transcript_760:28-270(-)